jgi:outer membrane lipoprotein-sorting protein
MFANRNRSAVLATLVSALLLSSTVAGVAAAGGPSTIAAQDAESIDDDEVIDNFVDRVETLETVEFTRTTRTEVDNQTFTATVRVAADLDDVQKRTETIDPAFGGNTTVILDGSDIVTYNHEKNTTTEAEARVSYVLPRLQPLANESLVSYEYLGTETVNGEKTYVIEGENPNADPGTDSQQSVTVYVDTETYFPVKHETENPSKNSSWTATYEDVSINEQIPDSRFELDVPTDTEQSSFTAHVDIESFDSYEEFSSESALSVPAASLPEGYTFDSSATFHTDDRTSAVVSYADGEDRLSVHTATDSMSTSGYEGSDAWERVEVGETVGYIYSSDDHTSLRFEDDQTYVVSGNVDDSTVLAVAESIVDG